MSESPDKRKRGWATLVALGVLLLPLLYVGGYLSIGLSKQSSDEVRRGYPNWPLYRACRPLAWIESRVTGKKVGIFVLGGYGQDIEYYSREANPTAQP